METRKNKHSSGKIFTFFIAFIGSLFILSCEKTETSAPASDSVNGMNERSMATLPIINNDRPLTIMDINHAPGMGLLTPDYEVKMLSNSTVVFEGRHNVGSMGTRVFKIDEVTFNKVVALFESSHFFDINDKAPVLIDAPVVYTTYAAKMHGVIKSLTLHDCNAIPENLVSLRMRVEKELGIPELVKINDSAETDGH